MDTIDTAQPTDKKPKKQPKPWDDTLRTMMYAIVLALVFRSFLFEPFHIPSSPMKDSLLIGDYLFVTKYSYGYSRYSFPLGLKLFEGRIGSGRPERGDVVVFRPEYRPGMDFIKRVVGLPGDRIKVREGELYINGVKAKREPAGTFYDSPSDDGSTLQNIQRYRETLPEGVVHNVLDSTPNSLGDNTQEFTVPPRHYFMMGDNRDNSADSRFSHPDGVGFVPEENLVGRADLVLLSMDDTLRWYKPWTWITALRFDRFLKVIR